MVTGFGTVAYRVSLLRSSPGKAASTGAASGAGAPFVATASTGSTVSGRTVRPDRGRLVPVDA